MKQILAFVLSLSLLSGAAFATTPYRAVTFSAVLYADGSGTTIPFIVLSNSVLIKDELSVPLSKVHLYDIVVNETDGEVDIIQRSPEVVLKPVLAGVAVTGVSKNASGLERYVTATVEFLNNPSNIGTAFSLLRYNAAGDIIYDDISFYTTYEGLATRGTIVTGAKVYNF